MVNYQCPQHPKYDSTRGDPIGETPLQARATHGGRENCVDCWKARSYYQEYRATRYNSLNNELEERIKDLTQLATDIALESSEK